MKKKQRVFLKLYEPIHDRFERFCRARVYGNMDYNDLMNETLLVAYDKLDTLKNDGSFLSFLFSISVRILANKKRKNSPDLFEPKDFLVSDDNASTETDIEVYLLHKALAQLNEEQREAIILFEISGFSIKEIGEIQGASESAIKQRLRRGRTRLTEILTFESEYKTGKSNG